MPWLGLLIWATADGDTSPSFFVSERKNELIKHFRRRIRRFWQGGKQLPFLHCQDNTTGKDLKLVNLYLYDNADKRIIPIYDPPAEVMKVQWLHPKH